MALVLSCSDGLHTVCGQLGRCTRAGSCRPTAPTRRASRGTPRGAGRPEPRRRGRGRTEIGWSMALTLGQCCIFGTAFNSECAASGPCGKTLPRTANHIRSESYSGPKDQNISVLPSPQRFGPECVASVPCECVNNITSTGITQAESDEPLTKRLAGATEHGGAINTQADFRCCMWAGGTYSVKSGCGQDGGYHKVIDPTSGNRDLSGNETDPQLLGNEADPRIWAVFREIAADTWGPICEYGGAGGGNFVNCQLSCYRNGFIPDGWEAACVKQPPSSPPGLPSWPSSPTKIPQHTSPDNWGRPGAALPFKAGEQPLEFDASLTRMCCPSGSTYDPHEFVGAECVGDVMKVAAITCSCRDLCNRTAVSGSRVYSGCSDRVTADEDSHADRHADLCDRWASALRPEPLGPRASDSITAFLDGWKLLCSASDGTFDGFSGSRLLLARQTWSVSSWSKCMYSCHIHGFTHDQWNTQCVWPSPPSSTSPCSFVGATQTTMAAYFRIWVDANTESVSQPTYIAKPASLEAPLQNPDRLLSIVIPGNKYLEQRKSQPHLLLKVFAQAYADFHGLRPSATYLASKDNAVYSNVCTTRQRQFVVSDAKTYQTETYQTTGLPAAATVNSHEYFGELTESFFGSNDFSPHNARELKRDDPAGYEYVKNSWDVSSAKWSEFESTNPPHLADMKAVWLNGDPLRIAYRTPTGAGTVSPCASNDVVCRSKRYDIATNMTFVNKCAPAFAAAVNVYVIDSMGVENLLVQCTNVAPGARCHVGTTATTAFTVRTTDGCEVTSIRARRHKAEYHVCGDAQVPLVPTSVHVQFYSSTEAPFYKFYSGAERTNDQEIKVSTMVLKQNIEYTFHLAGTEGTDHPFYISDAGAGQTSTAKLTLEATPELLDRLRLDRSPPKRSQTCC